MKGNTGKDVVRTSHGVFHGTTPAFAWKDGVKSRKSVPAEAWSKHLREKRQSLTLTPGSSALQLITYVSGNIRIKKSKETNSLYDIKYMKCGTAGQN